MHRGRGARSRRPLRAPAPGPRSPRAHGLRGRLRHHGPRRRARPLSPVSGPGRAGDDGPVAVVDGATARQGGHASDQQRRGRHQLRAARAKPAAPCLRSRAIGRPRDPRAAGRARRAHHDARRRGSRAQRGGSPHLRRRRRAASHRGRHGWRHLGGLRHHVGDPARIGVLRPDGHRPDVEAPQAALGVERPFRTRHRPQRRRRARRTGHGALRRGGRGEGRGRGGRRLPPTCRARSHPCPHEQGERRPRHRPPRHGDPRRAPAVGHRGGRPRRRHHRDRADVPARPRARDRHRRRGRPPSRVRRRSAEPSRGPATRWAGSPSGSANGG